MTVPRLSVLDQVPISKGMEGSEALHNTLDLAAMAEERGYHRYWIAEHHGLSLASTSPEVLIGPIASSTERIRVGSGGVMLPHYSPFKVAENFSMLSGLYPGRIDLGIGRASGTDPLTAYALQRDRQTRAPDDFPEQLAELLAFLLSGAGEDEAARLAAGSPPQFDAGHPFERIAGNLPGRPHLPEVWMLGSSPQSAVWAADLGLPYSFADFINRQGAGIAADYRERWSAAGERRHPPRTSVGAWVICADTTEEAVRLASSARMSFTKLQQGEAIAVPPVVEALEFLGDRATKPGRTRRTILGDPERVRDEIETLAADYGAEEVVVVTITFDHQARRRSYELLAEAFDLTAPAPASAQA